MKGLCFLAWILLNVGGALEMAPGETTDKTNLRPHWEVGMCWTVRVESKQFQDSDQLPRKVTQEWLFNVTDKESCDGKTCFRIVIRPIDAGKVTDEPRTTLWVEEKDLTVRRIEYHIPTPQGYKPIVKTYGSGGAFPLMGPLSALPLALPRFPDPGLKGDDQRWEGEFEVSEMSEGTKAIGGIGFRRHVKQRLLTEPPQELKSAVPHRADRAMEGETITVQLESPGEKTIQLWQPGQPWATVTDTGTSRAVLMAVFRVETKAQPGEKATNPDVKSTGEKSLIERPGRREGRADAYPWSGPWWPLRAGGLIGPLTKYDLLTGSQAAAWERENNPSGPQVPEWHGFCHAWAAAAMLEKEPRTIRDAPGINRRTIRLSVGDQKGMLTACHTQDLANSWGDRFGDEDGSEDKQDLYPDILWQLLETHIGQMGVSLVIDAEPGEEVWNYPICAFELTYQPWKEDLYQANLVLIMADDAVPPDYVGTRLRKQRYGFTFRMKDGDVVVGSGRWTGSSVEDHPDFAWYPYKAQAANPYVSQERVRQIVFGSSSVSPPPTVVANPPSPPVVPTVPPSPPSPPHPQMVTTDSDRVEPVILSPQELVALVSHQTSSFAFDLMLDRYDGASYRPGETFFVRVKSERSGYLYLLQIDSTGMPSLLYPLGGEDNRIPAQQLVEVRPRTASQGFPVEGPSGEVHVLGIVTSRPVAFTGCLDLLSSQGQNASVGDTTPQQAVQRQAVPFRWHPTQQRQVQRLLKSGKSPALAELNTPAPRDVLGEFAQDRSLFYVDAEKTESDTTPSQLDVKEHGR